MWPEKDEICTETLVLLFFHIKSWKIFGYHSVQNVLSCLLPTNLTIKLDKILILLVVYESDILFLTVQEVGA